MTVTRTAISPLSLVIGAPALALALSSLLRFVLPTDPPRPAAFVRAAGVLILFLPALVVALEAARASSRPKLNVPLAAGLSFFFAVAGAAILLEPRVIAGFAVLSLGFTALITAVTLTDAVWRSGGTAGVLPLAIGSLVLCAPLLTNGCFAADIDYENLGAVKRWSLSSSPLAAVAGEFGFDLFRQPRAYVAYRIGESLFRYPSARDTATTLLTAALAWTAVFWPLRRFVVGKEARCEPLPLVEPPL